MPQFSFDLASRSDHRECRRADPERIAIVLRRLAAVARGGAAAGLRALRLLPPLGRRGRSRRRLAGRARPLARPARPAPRSGRPLPCARRSRDGRLDAPLRDPAALPEALLEGLAWDAEGRRYETLDELFDYAARVAGAVGVMMTLIMGVRSPQALARACDLGVAMQLTNIARDVGEDARLGRIYLPRQWLREAGIDADDLARRIRSLDARRSARRRAAARRSGGALPARPRGIALLPANCRPAILAAALIYAEIGREIERNGFDSVTAARARVGDAQASTAGASDRRVAPRCRKSAPPPASHARDFLIEAAAGCRSRSGARAAADRRLARDPSSACSASFERLQRAERFGD